MTEYEKPYRDEYVKQHDKQESSSDSTTDNPLEETIDINHVETKEPLNDSTKGYQSDQSEIDELKAKLDFKEEEISKAKDSVLRAYAELENMRRRTQKDIEDAHRYSLEKFTDELLPVLDSMEQAVESASNICNTDDVTKTISSITEGVELTMRMLTSKMEKFGVKQINPKDEVFDPNKHEAIAMQPNDELLDNQVMDVFQKGYELNNRIIRPARVIVVKNKPN